MTGIAAQLESLPFPVELYFNLNIGTSVRSKFY